MTAIVGFLALCVIGVALSLGGGWFRDAFGSTWGNALPVILTVVGACLYFSIRNWRRSKSDLARAIAALSATLLLAFLSWFNGPDQLSSRAFQRVLDAEKAVQDYLVELRDPLLPKKPDVAERIQRLREKLYQRRLELRDLDARFPKSVPFYQSAAGLLFAALTIPFAVVAGVWGWKYWKVSRRNDSDEIGKKGRLR